MSTKTVFFGLAILAAPAMVLASGLDHSHAAYDKILKGFVKDARVDYAALKANPTELDRYLDQLASVSEKDFQEWNEKQKIAYLINLYNAQTLRLITDHYPLKSIKDIGNFSKGPWDQPVVRLFGRTRTLGEVEHQILRKDYREPRVHFALVCAAKGCPALRSEPFVAERLNEQLEEEGRNFMSNARKNRIDPAKQVLYLSPIFDWFEGDFIKKSGSVRAFVAPYFPKEASRELLKGDYKIKYSNYDWSLNEQEK